MKTRNLYSYSILKYVHDTATGEFINVGVALHCPENSFFKVKIRSTVGRISDVFPDLQTNSFRSLIKGISKRFTALSEAYATPLDYSNRSQPFEGLLHSVLPRDDSSLVWSSTSTGLTDNPTKTIENLYSRYVSKYDLKKTHARRTDEDVLRGFKKDLEDRRLLEFFDKKIIEDKGDKLSFPFAWKNGIWHCIEPISFDLSAPESIKDKAHKCLGQITSITESNDEFKLYLLLSPPSDDSLDSAFETAISILEKMPIENEIYFENNKTSLLDVLSNQIKDHNSISTH